MKKQTPLPKKKAAKATTSPGDTSLAFYGILLKSKLNKEWTKEVNSRMEKASKDSYLPTVNWKVRKKMLVLHVEREVASAYYQRKIGHGYFKSYLHRMNRTAAIALAVPNKPLDISSSTAQNIALKGKPSLKHLRLDPHLSA